jgi:DNA transformation protein
VEKHFVGFILDQLAGVERLGCLAMFGGYALYCGPTFFGIISKGGLYLKTDEASVREHVGLATVPFLPDGPDVLRTYYQVPAEVLQNRERLTRWANAAVLHAAGGSAPPSLAAAAAAPAAAAPGWASRVTAG